MSVTSFTLVFEFWPPAARGPAGNAMQAVFGFGGVVAAGVAALVRPWRANLAALLLLAAAPGLFAFCAGLPESPRGSP